MRRRPPGVKELLSAPSIFALMKRCPENGPKAAKSMGAEYQANPGSSRREYLNDSAHYFGEDKESFDDLSEDEKVLCSSAFDAGVALEKLTQQE